MNNDEKEILKNLVSIVDEIKKIVIKQDEKIKNLEEIELEHRILNSELIQKLNEYKKLEEKKKKNRERILRDIEKHIPRID